VVEHGPCSFRRCHRLSRCREPNVPDSAGAASTSDAAGARDRIQGQVTKKGASFSGADQVVLAQSSVKGDGAYGAIKPLPALAGRRGYYGKRSTQEEREARKRSETAKRRLWRGEQVVPAFPANLLV
jgi:hypothetical protein